MVVQCWDDVSRCKDPLETIAPWGHLIRTPEDVRGGPKAKLNPAALPSNQTARGPDEPNPPKSHAGRNFSNPACSQPSGHVDGRHRFPAAHSFEECPEFGAPCSEHHLAMGISFLATSASATSSQPPISCAPKATGNRGEAESSSNASLNPTRSPQAAAPRRTPCLPRKRRRALSDVDGADTGDLSIKKRRLRLHLITSRLSRPFSLPATHILNRESTANLPGDGKRFVKLAAYLSARRAAASAARSTSINHNASSVDLLRRAAVLNRVRVQVVNSGSAASPIDGFAFASPSPGFPRGGPTMAAAVACHGIQLVNAARFFFPSPNMPTPPGGPVGMQQWHHHHTPTHVRAISGPPPMSQHYGALLPKNPPSPFQVAHKLPRKIEYNHARLPPSPKLKPSSSRGANRCPGRRGPLPGSPDLRPPRERDFDDNDEVDNDSVAFPGSELDNRYADDDSDASDNNEDGFDFDIMFGDAAGLTPDDLDELEFEALDAHSSGSSSSNEHFYEEYLDELDGIRRPP